MHIEIFKSAAAIRFVPFDLRSVDRLHANDNDWINETTNCPPHYTQHQVLATRKKELTIFCCVSSTNEK